MALINSEFEFNNPRPNFKRDQYDTISAMKAVTLTAVDRGHLSFCKEDGKRYEFANDLDSNGNPIFDDTTGYWREYKSGGGDTITMMESEWSEILDDDASYAQFCQTYDGYILNVVEDYHADGSSDTKFGDTFPIVFS